MPPVARALGRAACLVATFLVSPSTGAAQDVAAQLRDLQSAIASLKAELAATRHESDDLRKQLQALREELAAGHTETQELLAAKVDDLEQTKVESGSKYHVRLSGLALLQGSITQGEVDSADLPAVARPAAAGHDGGNITGGARQSFVRLDVFGPRVRGARASAEATFDFFGGFPVTPEGSTTGLARFRTITASLEWEHARIAAGHDAPFISPASPTSLLSSAYPPLWAAGNLWTWMPQIHIDRRFAAGARTNVVLQGGVLDPLTGELPASEYERTPSAGERSRRPAVATRLAWERGDEGQRTTLGGGAYYSRQAWGFGRTIDSWATTGDWAIPIGARLSLSGEVYRGRAIAGLGGGASPSVVVAGAPDNAFTPIRPFRSAGGWAQVKVAAMPTLEFNAAVGTDRSAPSRLDALVRASLIDPATVQRNTSGFLNAIYTLRSNLLFSVEYRRLHTMAVDGSTFSAGHLSVGGGLGF